MGFSERAPAEIKLEFAFRVFDFDGDGRISETDLFHVMTIMVGKQFPSQKLSQICAELIQRGQAPPQKDERKEEEKFQVNAKRDFLTFDELTQTIGRQEIVDKMTIPFAQVFSSH